MGLNIQYALNDYGWAENLVMKIWATTGWIDVSWPGPLPVEPGKVADTVPCKYNYPNGMFTASIERVCKDQYVCPTCGCIPVPCGTPFYN